MKRWGNGSQPYYKKQGAGYKVGLVVEKLDDDTWVPEEWTKGSKDEQSGANFGPEEAEQISFEDMLENAFERSGVSAGCKSEMNIELEKG